MFLEKHAASPKLLAALVAAPNGDFSVRLPVDWTGVNSKVVDAFNEFLDLDERVSRAVEHEGKISQRLNLGCVSGACINKVESINNPITDLTFPISDMTRTMGVVAKGDLTQTMALGVEGRLQQGEFLRAAKTVNTMVLQLGVFTAEVARLAREVGTEGKLGGQVKAKGATSIWNDLTDSVDGMAPNSKRKPATPPSPAMTFPAKSPPKPKARFSN